MIIWQGFIKHLELYSRFKELSENVEDQVRILQVFFTNMYLEPLKPVCCGVMIKFGLSLARSSQFSIGNLSHLFLF
jgi:hypothetical protein